MVTKRTPALIFDFGNVVAHFDYRKACETLGPRMGLSPEAFLERVQGLGFTPLLQNYERGSISTEEFSRSFCELVGLVIAHEEFASAWSDIFWANEPLAPLIEFFKGRGYTLVLGSNTNDLHASQFRRQFAETLGHFDRLVLSYEIGHIKPTAAFYLACAEAAGEAPEHCVFIDDLTENVEGARAAGLVGLVFRDVPTLITDLARLGVEVPPSEG
jgi:putative hydrolase of the HAD superfamily